MLKALWYMNFSAFKYPLNNCDYFNKYKSIQSQLEERLQSINESMSQSDTVNYLILESQKNSYNMNSIDEKLHLNKEFKNKFSDLLHDMRIRKCRNDEISNFYEQEIVVNADNLLNNRSSLEEEYKRIFNTISSDRLKKEKDERCKTIIAEMQDLCLEIREHLKKLENEHQNNHQILKMNFDKTSDFYQRFSMEPDNYSERGFNRDRKNLDKSFFVEIINYLQISILKVSRKNKEINDYCGESISVFTDFHQELSNKYASYESRLKGLNASGDG